MTTNETPQTVRRCDVAVVGGSAAGLAAALQIQRQSRSVIVIDSGEPRNAPAARMHGYLGFDGAAPSDLVEAGRAEIRKYGGEVLSGRVLAVEGNQDDGFQLDAGDTVILARRVIAATGVVDELPPVEGLAEHWGKGVIHCPFCHGYEVRDSQLVQIVTHPIGLRPATMFTALTNRLTLLVPQGLELDADEVAALAHGGATVVNGTAQRVVEGPDGELIGLELEDGSRLDAEAVVVTTQLRPRVEPFAPLGLRAEPHPCGVADHVKTDDTGVTEVKGVYAVGNLTDPSLQVLPAAANGSLIGAMVALDLATEDHAVGGRRSQNEAEWEARYTGDQNWSGAPNGSLVAEVGGLTPGRALDVGAGEGGDALWLAQQGWDVTATDVAKAGLDRLTAAAQEQKAEVRCLPADANMLNPFNGETFDLVSLFYSAIPRTGDDRAITNLMNAVAPGGTLLMVGHGPTTADHRHMMPWDRESFVSIDHVAAAIQSTQGWTILASEVRERPPGSVSHHHHDKDVVLRATRAAE